MSNLAFTKEQMEEMKKLQKDLDDKIVEKHNLQEEDLSLNKYLALKTEFFEFVNELESFKHWKVNKGKDHILEEACDTLHFLLSLSNDYDVNLGELPNPKEYNKDNYEINELLAITDATISDMFEHCEYDLLRVITMFLLIALDKYNFTSEDLYNAYIEKNKENHKRQDNNY